jgi:hypothetical protein
MRASYTACMDTMEENNGYVVCKWNINVKLGNREGWGGGGGGGGVTLPIPSHFYSWAQICKHLRSPGIDSRNRFGQPVAWRTDTSNRVVVLARQAGNRFLDSLNGLQIRSLATLAGGIDPWNRFLGSLNEYKFWPWLLDTYLKTTWTVFPPPWIFASWWTQKISQQKACL